MKSSKIIFWLLFGAFVMVATTACKSQYEGTERAERTKKEMASKDAPPPNMFELLRRQPSLTVTGSPSDARIQIRGDRSITATNQPLFIVNGQRLGHDFSAIAGLNPGDIARLDVIRDPASLSAYGVGASNGVIEIRLKK